MLKNLFILIVTLTVFCFGLSYLTKDALGIEVDTGNILSNSTFGTGTTYSNDNWTITNEDYHNYTSLGGGNDPGGAVAADNATNIEQTIKLSEKTNMTEKEIQNGFSSTLSADIWYWNQYDNTTTLKQTITGSDGSTTIQQRIIEDDGCSYINCGSYTNYTDTHIQGSNTQTDFDIKVNVSNSNNRGSSHYGPDIDDIQLKVVYTYINPLDEDTQEVIDDIDETIDDAVENIDLEEEYFSWDDSWENEYYWEDEFTYEDEFTWEDEFVLEEEFYFEEDIDIAVFEEFTFEEFEEVIFFDEFEEITMEETFFEESFEEPQYIEEIFEEEFTEEFTSFIEETGMTEEFEQFLEDEGITQEEFFEEIVEESFEEESDFVEPTEEAFNEEITEDNMDESVEMEAESFENEESILEVASNEEEAVEETTNTEAEEQLDDEDGQVSEETSEESESDSTDSDESDVQTASSEEQEDIQQEEDREIEGGESKGRVEIAKFEKELKKNIKKLVQEVKASTQNLTKEDVFFRSNNSLDAYTNVSFYKSKDIYANVDNNFFQQADLSVYGEDIYTNVTLASYSLNDPIEVHKQKMNEITIKKNKLQMELELLKGL